MLHWHIFKIYYNYKEIISKLYNYNTNHFDILFLELATLWFSRILEKLISFENWSGKLKSTYIYLFVFIKYSNTLHIGIVLKLLFNNIFYTEINVKITNGINIYLDIYEI